MNIKNEKLDYLPLGQSLRPVVEYGKSVTIETQQQQ